MHDCAALQYHNPVREAEYLLGILFDDDGANAASLRDGPERQHQFLDDDRRETLGRLVEQKHLGIERQRPADGQHLLFAAGQFVAEIGLAFGQARKHFVNLVDSPRPRLRYRGHVFLDGERFENVALLRHPADAFARALIGTQRRDVLSLERDDAAEAPRDADDGIDKRGFSGAVAAQQRQHLTLCKRERQVRDHHGFAVARTQILDVQQFRHLRPRRDRRLLRADRARLQRADLRPASRR